MYAVVNFLLTLFSATYILISPTAVFLDSFYILIIFSIVKLFDICFKNYSEDFRIWMLILASLFLYYPLSKAYAYLVEEIIYEGVDIGLYTALMVKFYILGVIFSFLISLKAIPKSKESEEVQI